MLINLKKHVFKVMFCLLILSSIVNTAFSFNLSEKKLLALKGDTNTQYQLGLYYQAGKNIDVIEAYYWMKMAAEQNHPSACRYMGRAHLYGKGTSSSIDLAKKWFLISSIREIQTRCKIWDIVWNWKENGWSLPHGIKLVISMEIKMHSLDSKIFPKI